MLSALETRVPPPLLLVALAAVLWFLAGNGSSAHHLAFGLPIIVLGLSLNAIPKVLFRRAGTTVSPLRPEKSSTLITSGLYRHSRNPMYLGYAIALIGWAICLGQPVGLAVVGFYVGYVTRFQIMPEERQLAAMFPDEYAVYSAAVRRWI
ncbi:isoprenylcysteine carboxylmethyltransferase family protein [Stenotrophomonas sp.]|uniref:methyltransferase family protein n=1 Tax=Stenotrophomonas sp. TaxID=69392 RepID=UPI0028977AEB|nr:isoprenylcysteine carboxylmethyltransferase family protein [Stenotrophomonas sp.]